jgi:hypothetical protein
MSGLSRREFIAATASSAVASTSALAYQDPYDRLLKLQYSGNVRLRVLQGYLGNDFRLSSTPTEWRLAEGRYRGRYSGTNVDLHGYWIFLPNANRCWQVMNRGNGPLRFWNADGRATGKPEDFELFSFSEVDRAGKTAKVFNASLGAYNTATGGTRSKPYVGLVQDTFACDETAQGASIFTVEFV